MANSQSLDLTDSEWMALIRNTDDSGLPTCCANISALRDAIIVIASERADVLGMGRTGLLRAYGAARDGHELEQLPVLEKLMRQIDASGRPTRADLPTRHEGERIEFRDDIGRDDAHPGRHAYPISEDEFFYIVNGYSRQISGLLQQLEQLRQLELKRANMNASTTQR